jgi:hypothetical protein
MMVSLLFEDAQSKNNERAEEEGSVWISVSHAMGYSSPSSKKEELGFEFICSLWEYSNAKQTRWVSFSAVSTISLTKCLLGGKARTVSIMI